MTSPLHIGQQVVDVVCEFCRTAGTGERADRSRISCSIIVIPQILDYILTVGAVNYLPVDLTARHAVLMPDTVVNLFGADALVVVLVGRVDVLRCIVPNTCHDVRSEVERRKQSIASRSLFQT